MVDWSKPHIPPQKPKIYLVYAGEDEDAASWFRENLKKAGFDVIDYKVGVHSSPLNNFHKWIQEATYVLFIVSNKWARLSVFLDIELGYAIQFKNDNRLDQFIYAVAIDKLETQIMLRFSGIADVKRITEKNMDMLFSEYVEAFNTPPIIKPKYDETIIEPKHSPTGILNTPRIGLNQSIVELMTKDPKTFSRDDEISTLVGYYAIRGFRHFPVTEGKRLIGMVTLRDILKQENPDISITDDEGGMIFPPKIIIGDFMTPHDEVSRLFTLRPQDTVKDAIKKLEARHFVPSINSINTQRRISAFTVVDDKDNVLGIVSYMDVLKKCSIPEAKVEQVMTNLAKSKIVIVYHDSSLADAHQQMGSFRDLPVIHSNTRKLVGMITEYEILKNFRENTRHVKVGTVMRYIEELPILKPEDDLNVCIKIFLRNPVLSALVVRDTENNLKGIISYVDILRHMLNR